MQKIRTLLAIALLAAVAQTASAGNCCPDCGTKVCTFKWVQKTVKKKVYKVECKDICIPAIRLPWQMCCDPKCGKVRTVKVLKTLEVKCTKCGCEWSVQTVAGCGAKASAKACGCNDCAARLRAEAKPNKRRSSFPSLVSFTFSFSSKPKPKAQTKKAIQFERLPKVNQTQRRPQTANRQQKPNPRLRYYAPAKKQPKPRAKKSTLFPYFN